MTRRRWIGLGLVAVLALGAGGFWYFFLRDDAPARVSLEGALGTSTTVLGDGGTLPAASATTAPGDGGTLPPAPATTAPPASDGVDGTWGIAPGTDTFVGYRVQEELSGIGAATAVGRSPEIEAVLELREAVVTRLDVEADLTALESDSSQRDGQLRSRGLETNTFPTASFVLTEPIELDAVPVVGVPVMATATGDLTLHGVTRPVQVEVQAQRTDSQIVVVGSLPIFLPDYDIEAPTGLRVLSIDDNAEMEFQLFFTRG